MKVLYTKKFKEALSQPWRNISLGMVKLRGGTNTGLTKKNITEFPEEFIGNTLSTNLTYNAEIIKLPEGGIQIFIEIPKRDQSLFLDEFEGSDPTLSDYFYQVIMFFYTDLLTGIDEIAFVCYDTLEYEKENVIFTGLKLNTRRNIITIPGFSWRCNIKFSQSEVTKFLESPIGDMKVNPISKEGGIVSRESWDTWIIDSVSENLTTPWTETTYLNKYGIKIY